jgi:hypothetical protein
MSWEEKVEYMGEKRNAYVSVGKHRGKSLVWRSGHWQENNAKMDFEEIRLKCIYSVTCLITGKSWRLWLA